MGYKGAFFYGYWQINNFSALLAEEKHSTTRLIVYVALYFEALSSGTYCFQRCLK